MKCNIRKNKKKIQTLIFLETDSDLLYTYIYRIIHISYMNIIFYISFTVFLFTKNIILALND